MKKILKRMVCEEELFIDMVQELYHRDKVLAESLFLDDEPAYLLATMDPFRTIVPTIKQYSGVDKVILFLERHQNKETSFNNELASLYI
jgi:hypothetical protein